MAKTGKGVRTRRTAQKKAIEDHITEVLTDLVEFEEFKQLLPKLREALSEGKDPQALRAQFLPLVQARVINDALLSPDPKVRIAAARDIQDREEGKPKQTIDSTHRLEGTPDEELDSIIKSKLEKTLGSKPKQTH